MLKRVNFEGLVGSGWPDCQELERRFWARLREQGTVSGQLSAQTVHDVARLEAREGRIDVDLQLGGDREHGVILQYWKRGYGEVYSFTGDSSRLREWIFSSYETWLPVALFIPAEKAWNATREFIETEGALPQSIDWIATRDLPPNSFSGADPNTD